MKQNKKEFLKMFSIILITSVALAFLFGCKQSTPVEPLEPVYNITGTWKAIPLEGYTSTKTSIALLNENGKLSGTVISDCFKLFGDFRDIPFNIMQGTVTKSTVGLYDITLDAKLETIVIVFHLSGNIRKINGVETMVAHVTMEWDGNFWGDLYVHLIKESNYYTPKTTTDEINKALRVK